MILAGEVVSAVTGLSSGAAIDRFVVQPLHLTDTGYVSEGREPRPRIGGVLYLDDVMRIEIETVQYR